METAIILVLVVLVLFLLWLYFRHRSPSKPPENPPAPPRPKEETMTTVDPAAFFDKVVGEYAPGTFETRKIGAQWCLMDKSYSEDYSLAVIEDDILYLTYSLQGEDARPFHPLYKDMDKGTPRRFKKLCACIPIHSPRAGAKLRAYIDMYNYKKA